MSSSNLFLGSTASGLHTENISGNTAIGMSALGDTSLSGTGNTALGYNALAANTDGSYNTAVGAYAMKSAWKSNHSNTSIGYNSMSGSAGSSNVVIGKNAFKDSNSTSNIVIGNDALSNNKNWGQNIAIGETAMSNSSGSYNIAIGYNTLTQTPGDHNIAIGLGALPKVTGSYNTLIGENSMCNNITTGTKKTCIGYTNLSMEGNSFMTDTSKPMIMLGGLDGKVIIPGDLLVMGNLWFHARPTNSESRFEIARLAFNGGQTDKDGHDIAAISNKMTCPNWYPQCIPSASWSEAKVFYDYSDKRLKNIKGVNKSGLEQLRNIQVFNFTFKNDKEKKPQVGVIAQDLKKIFPDAVTKDDDGYLLIRKDDMFYAVINAVKQLDKIVQGLIAEFKTALIKINSHDNEIKKLQKENEELKARIEKLEKLIN